MAKLDHYSIEMESPYSETWCSSGTAISLAKGVKIASTRGP
jgi:hypothetical protein